MILAILGMAPAQAGGLQSEGPLAIRDVRSPERVSRFAPVEIAFRMTGTWNNALDPAQIEVAASVLGAQDSVSAIHGFYFQDFESVVSGGKEVLTTKADPDWRIRFCPWNIGGYGVFLRITDRLMTISPEKIGIRVEKGDGGFLQTKEKSRYFHIGDSPTFLMGPTLSAAGQLGTHAWRSSLDRVKAAGGNYCRVLLDPAELGAEFQSPAEFYLAPSIATLESAWKIERLLQLARERGIFVCLSLISGRQLGAQWATFRYSKANGGPCGTPEEFFTNLRARLAFKWSVRYLISRIQSFDNLAGIELATDVEAPSYWTQEVVNEVVGEHTYLIPVSTLPALEDTWRIEYVGYATAAADFGSTPAQTSALVAAAMRETIARTSKPIVVIMRGKSPSIEHEVAAFWTAVATGAAAGAVWRESLAEPTMEYHSAAAVLSKFSLSRRQFADFTLTRTSGEPAYGIADRDGALIFVRAPDASQPESVDLAMPSDGQFAVTWLDASTGQLIAESVASVKKSQGLLTIPAAHQGIVGLLARK
jgi:hypothetical protein